MSPENREGAMEFLQNRQKTLQTNALTLNEQLNQLKSRTKEKIDSLSEYSENAWGDLVEFWKKVSTQIQEHDRPGGIR